MRAALLLALFLAACGGADHREHGPGSDTPHEKPLSLDVAGTMALPIVTNDKPATRAASFLTGAN